MTKFDLIRLVHTLFNIYSWLLLARIIMMWFQVDSYNPAVQFVARVTDPVLRFFRGLLPTTGMIDFSPILAFFALRLVQQLVVQLLWRVL